MNHHNNLKSTSNKSVFRILGLFFLVASYSFLAYKLITYKQYHELVAELSQFTVSRYSWLVVVFLLLPINWLIESLKWKLMTVHVQTISLKTSVKSVLAGITTGFFTPNRVGDLVGRVMYLDTENRKSGVTLSLLSSLTQNMVMTLCGLPACILFFATTKTNNSATIYYPLYVLICLILIGLIYFFLPQISSLFNKSRFSDRIKEFTDCLSNYSPKELLQIISVALFRYMVFCVQFYFMLKFFGIELSVLQALIAIPTSYLFVTFTPSFAFSDAAVRSSIAVLVIGIFSPKVIGIALAGMCIWLINFVMPMLVGSVLIVRKR